MSLSSILGSIGQITDPIFNVGQSIISPVVSPLINLESSITRSFSGLVSGLSSSATNLVSNLSGIFSSAWFYILIFGVVFIYFINSDSGKSITSSIPFPYPMP